MQEFRPLERSMVEGKFQAWLRHWKEYARELREASVSLPIKDHLLLLLQEHPTMPWRLSDSLAQESGISLSLVQVSLNELVVEGKVHAHKVINGKTYYATKERANKAEIHRTPLVDDGCPLPTPGWAGEAISDPDNDFNFNHTKSAPDMFSDLEKILNDACLKVKEAAKINEQLFNLERDVTSSQNTAIR